jgi:hypothetical protein
MKNLPILPENQKKQNVNYVSLMTTKSVAAQNTGKKQLTQHNK